MDVVFTDLDGTLLDHDTYSFDAAKPALERLARRRTPVVFTTSKTRAETEYWRRATGTGGPFIVENGGAIIVPGEETIRLGERYETLVEALARASRESACAVRGFHDMTTREIAELCGLRHEEASLARRREYDEPFVILDEARASALLAAIERLGCRWTRGGRFHHILGNHDKAAAVRRLLARFRQRDGAVRSIGLGDGWNDLDFLRAVDVAVIIRSPQAERLLHELPHARVTSAPGPEGWNRAILEMVPE